MEWRIPSTARDPKKKGDFDTTLYISLSKGLLDFLKRLFHFGDSEMDSDSNYIFFHEHLDNLFFDISGQSMYGWSISFEVTWFIFEKSVILSFMDMPCTVKHYCESRQTNISMFGDLLIYFRFTIMHDFIRISIRLKSPTILKKKTSQFANDIPFSLIF